MREIIMCEAGASAMFPVISSDSSTMMPVCDSARMLTARDVAMIEAAKIRSYLATIPQRERRHFGRRICMKANLDKYNWYNWLFAKCRMPDFVRTLIEKEANCVLFDDTRMM